MLILLIIVFLLIVSATLFLICRKRKKGKIVYAISMGIFLFLFLRYQRESGILKNFSDYKEAYYENYNGEIRFVLNGDKTDLIVGVNENGVQNYVMVYKWKIEDCFRRTNKTHFSECKWSNNGRRKQYIS